MEKIKLLDYEYKYILNFDKNIKFKDSLAMELKNLGHYNGVYDIEMTIDQIINNCEIQEFDYKSKVEKLINYLEGKKVKQ